MVTRALGSSGSAAVNAALSTCDHRYKAGFAIYNINAGERCILQQRGMLERSDSLECCNQGWQGYTLSPVPSCHPPGLGPCAPPQHVPTCSQVTGHSVISQGIKTQHPLLEGHSNALDCTRDLARAYQTSM